MSNPKPEKRNLDEIFKEIGFPDPPNTPPQITHDRLPKGPCGKTMWNSESSARAGARAILKKKTTNVGKLRTYFCTKCAGWHVTSSFRS